MNLDDKDKQKGLYTKFKVTRTDGSSKAGKKHFACEYFVLDLNHDPLAIPAIRAYSLAATAAGYHQLGEDLWKKSQALAKMLANKQRGADVKK